MSRRLPLALAALAALLLVGGLAGLDRPLAEWIHAGHADLPLFVHGLGLLDTAAGIHLWFWLAGCVALTVGAVATALLRRQRWPRAVLTAALVQLATLATMIAGKTAFGRLRPHQVFESGDWSQTWFIGGGSFPSGHSAFYFGLLLPLAAACPIRWLRAVLLAIPLFVAGARIDLEKHFLSDVSASALIAALYTLLAAILLARWRGAEAGPAPAPEPAR